MNCYNNLSSTQMSLLKKINDKIVEEEKKDNPNNNEILKLKQQILMKGIEMFAGFDIENYNPYKTF